MKPPEIIVIGELNVDIILNRIDRFPEMGKEILAGDLDLTLGSSSAIFAGNLSSLGSRVAFIGKIGNDGFSSTVLGSLQKLGVDTSHIIRSSKYNTGATIVLNFGNDRAMVTYPGAMEDLNAGDIDHDFLETARHLHFSSVFLQPGIRPSLPGLFKQAKAAGLTTSLDPQWDPEEKWEINATELFLHLDIFMPNMAEFLNLTASETLEKGIEKIKQYAPQLILVIKDGINGAYAWNGSTLIHQPALLNENPVDCIGAGDSFNAGFIRKFTRGASLVECLEYGALTGAVSTTCAGGTGAFADIKAAAETALKQFNKTL
ncbi:MAG TPA: carbohydrate kinase family protein [Bacteroidales bacterium]|nr:carbohydrate kinase family protein [Bacteroidales bacterium]